MKRRTLLSTVILLLVTVSCLNAQDFTIGADNGMNGQYTYPTPFGDYYKTQRMQFLYRASELTAAGMTTGFIDEISWTVDALPGGIDVTEGYTVKMLSTGVTSLGLTTWEPGASIVWGPENFTPVLGVNTFVLDVPFFWDGSSNIIIEICGGSAAGVFTKNARCTWTGPLAFNASHTYRSDIDPAPCSYTGIDYFEDSPGGPDYRPQVIFHVVPGTECASIPDLGVTASTLTNACVGETFTLSIDPIAEMGISYQWFSSTGGPYVEIAGATLATYATTQTETTSYRCRVTCDISGDQGFSDPVTVTQNDPTDCYCTPTYNMGTASGDYINNFNLGAISNLTGASPAPYYTYYSGLTTNLNGGVAYSLTAQVGTYLNQNGFAVWIDYDQNGNFESTEKLGEVINLNANATGTINFTVPITALGGTTRMRIREVWNMAGILPCLTYEYGETEDYNVNIIPGVVPTAAFTYAGDPTVAFTNTSTGLPTSYSWTFGDGGTSTLTNPTHTYATNGVYNVCLTATNLYGSNTACQNVTIDAYIPPIAEFSFFGEPTVIFTDLSLNSPTSWLWNFGDGATSTEENPIHTYTYNGVFNVCLTASSIGGSDTHCETITIDYYLAPVADFTYTGDPTVSFTDISSNDPTSWFWNFGDGGTSSLENPVHTYTENGTYTVCLTATNVAGPNTHCESIVIDSYLAPFVDFSFSGDPIVSFVDESLNEPTSWLWNFDDGGTSTLENPTHTFLSDGVYNVCLTATNATGSNTGCQDVTITSYINVPIADFVYSGDPDLSFTDVSLNDPTYWSWDFGDGGTSTLENPVHLYTTDGTFLVCLTAGNIAGEDTECKNVVITSYSAPEALFTYSGDPVVSFTDGSTGSPTSWLWNFDDGGVSTLPNPTHEFESNGVYNVCLSVVGPGGSDVFCQNVTIEGNGTAPVTDFTYSVVFPTVLFTDISTNAPSDWLWDFGDGFISGLQNPNHNYAVPGNYTVCLSATNDFGTTENCKTVAVFPNSITDMIIAELAIYPNPTMHDAVISGVPQNSTIRDIYVVNTLGEKTPIEYTQMSGNTNLTVNTTTLPAGTYMLVITTDKGAYGGQLVKL